MPTHRGDIFAGSFFLEMCLGIAAADFERQAAGFYVRARFRDGRAAADFLKLRWGLAFIS